MVTRRSSSGAVDLGVELVGAEAGADTVVAAGEEAGAGVGAGDGKRTNAERKQLTRSCTTCQHVTPHAQHKRSKA